MGRVKRTPEVAQARDGTILVDAALANLAGDREAFLRQEYERITGAKP